MTVVVFAVNIRGASGVGGGGATRVRASFFLMGAKLSMSTSGVLAFARPFCSFLLWHFLHFARGSGLMYSQSGHIQV